MQVCEKYHIRHSEFLAWSRLDRDKAVWWHVRDRGTCQSCGTRDEEWDEELGGDRFAYVAAVGHCRGCEVKAQAQRELDNAPPGSYRVGSYATLVRQ